MKKNPYLKKNEVCLSFSKLQTCIQINKKYKSEKETLIFLLYKIIIITENT